MKRGPPHVRDPVNTLVRAHLAPLIVMSCIVMLMLYLLFLPPLLSLDIETDGTVTQYDYGVDDPSFLAELPSKPPLDHLISPILLSTACISVV